MNKSKAMSDRLVCKKKFPEAHDKPPTNNGVAVTIAF